MPMSDVATYRGDVGFEQFLRGVVERVECRFGTLAERQYAGVVAECAVVYGSGSCRGCQGLLDPSGARRLVGVNRAGGEAGDGADRGGASGDTGSPGGSDAALPSEAAGRDDGGDRLAVKGETPRGPNWARNQKGRERRRRAAAAAVAARRGGESQEGQRVPAWRVRAAPLAECGERDSELGRTWAERRIIENKIAVEKGKRELAGLERGVRDEGESGAAKTLVSVRAVHPQLDETWAQRKIRENEMAIARMDAQMAKMKREQEDGTAEKRYKVEANLVQGQLDGAFALVPQRRVVSWAKTITSNGTSSTGSSRGKKSQASIPSVSSGLGSRSATTISAREKQLEVENEKLREREQQLEQKTIIMQRQLEYAKMRYG